MKKLTLSNHFKNKLNRLKDKVGPLTYLGADLSEYDNKPMVAIVGTRKPTPYGKMMTEQLAEGLARAGVVVISGNALGVDGIAHSATLLAGGKTISVLPSGLDNIYPATNRQIGLDIVKSGGTLISEYPSDHQPRKEDFLHRNRLIAALSDVVVIPEAAANSGSLNTANHAKQMDIPICAVPGNTTSPMSAGTNYLLKTGGQVVTEAGDILKLLNIDTSQKQTQLDLMGDSPAETLILQKIAAGLTTNDQIQTGSDLSTAEFQTAITMLEVQGKVAQNSLGSWRLK